ncbi:TPA: hypothetical protein N0F65_008978 [Lagenidium giganteum]|uniref:Tudor domain-containing protein n=1 Tax=Lagenidium giganteum TaxID=4803 RepID=A0AAV2YLZ2_9STRA|nr:TPA: hypothetical protein N0F65_008978 [Lagenidium giganteum]
MRSSDDGDSIASGSDLIDSDHSRSGSLNASNGPVKSPSAAGERSGDEYDEEEFEDYSDSFEDDEDEEPSIPKDGKSSAHQSDEVGERVQVFWEDDNVWFDGVVRRTRGQEVYIDYDDGESAWEATSLLRVSPELYDWAPQQYDQLQVKQSEDQKCDLTDRAVAVYWPEENEWFKGAVRTANSMHGLLVCYEDGDSRWEHVRQWPQWISATAEKYADVDAPQGEPRAVEKSEEPSGRVLLPRPYKPSCSHHFQPVRTPRVYTSVVLNHTCSVLTPRKRYVERAYLHVKTMDCITITATRLATYSQVDTATQTLIITDENRANEG